MSRETSPGVCAHCRTYKPETITVARGHDTIRLCTGCAAPAETLPPPSDPEPES